MYFILSGIAWLLSRCSWSSIARLAWVLSGIAYHLRFRRRIVSKNLNIAFGDTITPMQRQNMARQCYYHFTLTALETLRSQYLDIAADITLQNADYIRQALREQNGVYILCMHMGNWEAQGAATTRLVTPCYVFVKRVGSPGVDRWVQTMRRRNGFEPLLRQKKGDGVRMVKETLGRGEIIGFVADQARPGEPRLPFFGVPAKTNTSLAAIVRRLPAPVVPSYIRRLAPGRHVLEFLPPLELQMTDDADADILRHTQQFNDAVEAMIRQNPEQYFWLHDRWK